MSTLSVEVEMALVTRRSVRGFLPREVPPSAVERILELGARAPRGTHIQPRRGHVRTGRARPALSCARCGAHASRVIR